MAVAVIIISLTFVAQASLAQTASRKIKLAELKKRLLALEKRQKEFGKRKILKLSIYQRQ